MVALIAAAVLGAKVATRDGRGDLTTATLSVSLSNELFDDVSCRPVESASPRQWTCRVYISDESGGSAQADYVATDRGHDCWAAVRRGDDGGTLEQGPPARRASACIPSRLKATSHSLLD